MRRLPALALCAVLFALLTQAQTPDQSIPPLIGVYLDFDHVPESVSVEAMKRAVEALLKPAGIRLAWRLTSQNLGRESFPGLAVVKFRGRCKAEVSSPTRNFGTLGETETLASTEVSAGRVLPYSKVECDEIRKALAYAPKTSRGQLEQALGLALGRVVAHELYHILAQTTSHASEGLAKTSQFLRDLVSRGEMGFDQATARAIQEEFSRRK